MLMQFCFLCFLWRCSCKNETQLSSVVNSNRLMLFRERLLFLCGKRLRHKLCYQNSEIVKCYSSLIFPVTTPPLLFGYKGVFYNRETRLTSNLSSCYTATRWGYNRKGPSMWYKFLPPGFKTLKVRQIFILDGAAVIELLTFVYISSVVTVWGL